jgi:hypothetical protein
MRAYIPTTQQNAHIKAEQSKIMTSKTNTKDCYSRSCMHPTLIISSSPFCIHLSPSRLKKLHVLLRVRLLNIALGNLLHHEVGIDVDFLAQLTVRNAPLAADGKCADGGFGVDERVDARFDVCEGEFVGCLCAC